MLKLLLSLCLCLSAAANANVFSSKEDATEHKNSVSDQELEGKIRDKIGNDQVNVKVKDGVVTLDGTVPTQDDKDNVEKEVRHMSGVKGLNSNLSVNESQAKSSKKTEFNQDTYLTSTDDQLNKKIRDKVSRGWLWDSYKEVALNTSNGVVTLEGNVNSISDQQKLMTEIQKVEGVKSVKSNLKIKNAPVDRKGFKQDTYGSAADNDLNKKIRDKVSRGWLWDSYEEVTLNTTSGVVTLEGVVEGSSDQQKLMTEIQKVDGVKSVKSNLRIKNPGK